MASEVYVPAWLTKRLLIMGFHMETPVYPLELPSGATAESFLSPPLFQSTTAEPPSLELLFEGEDDPSTGQYCHRAHIWLEALKPYFFSPRDEASRERPREDQPCDWLATGSVVGTDLATPDQPVPTRVYLTTRHDGKLDAGYAQFQLPRPTTRPTFNHLIADFEEMIELSECDPLARLRRKPVPTPTH